MKNVVEETTQNVYRHHLFFCFSQVAHLPIGNIIVVYNEQIYVYIAAYRS